jgi:hypothetical protein
MFPEIRIYGGSQPGNGSVPLRAEDEHWINRARSLSLTLSPLAGIVLVYEGQ